MYCPNCAGEIVPQAICSHYGLAIGAWTAWFVRLLMIVSAPISWPISKLLDYLLGSEHTVGLLSAPKSCAETCISSSSYPT